MIVKVMIVESPSKHYHKNIVNGITISTLIVSYNRWASLAPTHTHTHTHTYTHTHLQLREEEITIITQYALRGLEYLHFKRKIHRDIKAGNILLNLEGHAKLGELWKGSGEIWADRV